MKAIQVHEFGEPENMTVDEIPDPEVGPGEVLVRVHAVGVNPVDTYIRAGVYAWAPSIPYTPGMDAAGTVEAIGDGVTRVAEGDRVYTAGTISGSYAEKCLCNETQVFVLPENITFPQGAALGVPYGTAHRALFHRGRAKQGETLFIHGASGGVGIAAIQIAKTAGLTVIGSAGSDEGLTLIAEQGADHQVNHHDADHMKQVLELTGGNGVDLILEMLANINLGIDLPALARGGRVVVIGSRGNVEINPRDTMMRDADILGMTLMNATVPELEIIHAALREGLQNRTLNPIISRELPLTQAPQAHHDVIETSPLGKIVLTP